MNRYCFILDLKDDAALIAEYEAYHRAVWPEILQSIRESGIADMQIYRRHNRLMMIMDTDDAFSFVDKAKADASNEKVQQWEALMWKYQQSLPGMLPDEKWQLMNKIFQL
jgi:L-rhamnose mutarotase